MRKGGAVEWILLVLALVCFAYGYSWGADDARPPLPGERLEDGLRIMTWNVGGALAEEARPLRDEDVEQIAAVLQELRPDLCFLQEVHGARQATLLLGALGEGWSAEVSRGRLGRRIVALSTMGPFAVEDGAPRGALAVSLRVTGGWRLQAMGVHADAFSAERRNELLGAATDVLLATEEAELRILAGDFNLDLDLDKRRDLFSDDAYRDVETYNYVAEHMLDAARGAGATAEPDRRLDYVFLAGERVRIHAAGPLRGRRLAGMDHHPVVVDLRLVD